MMDLDDIRREYLKDGLRRDNLHEDPLQQFEHWMAQAIDAKLPDPTAMTVATVNAEGEPSQRIVLLKHLDDQGFVFFTNYSSRKANDIQTNNRVSLHFPWHMFERQVKVNGIAEKISTQDSLRYFLSRPHDSQIAAWASEQSHTISSRQFLDAQFESIKAKFKKGEVPLPDFWGGYRIKPYRYEFWQGGAKRLHDRFEYSLLESQAAGQGSDTLSSDKQSWQIKRLAP